MKIKAITAQVKAAGVEEGLGLGQFTAYASVFGNVDSYGDVVHKGAFADTLAEWKDSGAPIPVYWSHQMGLDPLFNLGEVLSAEEDEKGLLVTAQLDIENNDKAAYTYRLLKGRRVQQMSFAYDVIDGEEREDSSGLDLKALKLHEISVVPLGANQETEVLDVKKRLTGPSKWDPLASIANSLQYSAGGLLTPTDNLVYPSFGGQKSGRALSAKNETTLRTALESLSGAQKAINDVLSILGSDDQDEASGSDPAKGEEPATVKSKEPNPNPTVDAWTALLDYELEGL